jgi:hypothetical protein
VHINLWIYLSDEIRFWRNKNAHIRKSCGSSRDLHQTECIKTNVFSRDFKEKSMHIKSEVFAGDSLLKIRAQFVLRHSVFLFESHRCTVTTLYEGDAFLENAYKTLVHNLRPKILR